jgi:hypothetical protein
MKRFFLWPVFLLAISSAFAQEKREGEEAIDLALDKARQSVREANYEEAVNYFARCLDLAEMNERRHSSTQVYSALQEWHTLAEKHPPALEAFVARRDQDTAKVLNMGEDKKDINEAIPYRPPVQRVTLMNRHLDQHAKTVALFKTIESKYPNFAQFVDEFCSHALITGGEYDLVLKYLGDPESGFEAARKEYLFGKERERKGKAGIFAGSYERNFVSDMNRFLEVLYASGATEKAEALREKSSELVESPMYFVPKKD